MSGGPALIELDGVTRIYPGAVPVHALRPVDLRVSAGDLVSITGASGSGKSTLLGLLGLLDRPSTGTVRVLGKDVSRASDADRTRLRSRTLGFVFQQFHLIPHLTAGANVETALLHRGLAPAERRRRAAEALDRVGLAPRAGHRPVELSGGEQQRVAIARAVVGEPRVVLADEPTGALDSANAERVLEVMISLVDRSTALVIVTHDPAVAARAQRRIHMADGRVVPEALSPGPRAPGPGTTGPGGAG